MVDDLPTEPAVTTRELDAVECYLGDVLAELLQEDSAPDGALDPGLRSPLPPSEDAA